MTLDDHKKAVSIALEIMNQANSTTESKKKPFVVLGDPNAVDVKCFWYKVRCIYCNDVLILYLPKKNLEANLQNHLRGTKHETIVVDADKLEPNRPALSIGRQGRLSNSFASLGPNQLDLHSWFSNTGSRSQAGNLRSTDNTSFILVYKLFFFSSCARVIGILLACMLEKLWVPWTTLVMELYESNWVTKPHCRSSDYCMYGVGPHVSVVLCGVVSSLCNIAACIFQCLHCVGGS
jgi:hypothetical protein